MNSLLNSALRQTARALSISPKLAEKVYQSYWGFIRDYVENLHIRTMTEEEFNSVTTAPLNQQHLWLCLPRYHDAVSSYCRSWIFICICHNL